MNINSVNNYGIDSVGNAQSSALEKIATGLSINSASDNSSSLAIATNLNVQRSTLNQSLSNVNSGIAVSNIAQGGINEQKNILEKIQTLSLQASSSTTSQDGKEAIKNDISHFLDQFNAIASSTTYNGQQLLTGDEKDLSVITDTDDTINMNSVETKSISSSIGSFLDTFTTNEQSLNNLFDATKNGLAKLSELETQFASSSTQLASAGRTALSAQTSIAQANSSIQDIDYGKAVSDFSKSNITAQIGLLAATQANAIQARNVALLS